MSQINKKIDLKSKVRRIPEFKGVVFWDITPLLKDKDSLHASIKQLAITFGKETLILSFPMKPEVS